MWAVFCKDSEDKRIQTTCLILTRLGIVMVIPANTLLILEYGYYIIFFHKDCPVITDMFHWLYACIILIH